MQRLKCFFQQVKLQNGVYHVNPFGSTLNRKYFVGLVFVYHVLQLVNMCMFFITFVCLSLIALNSTRCIIFYTVHLEKVPSPTLPHYFPS